MPPAGEGSGHAASGTPSAHSVSVAEICEYSTMSSRNTQRGFVNIT